MEEKLYCSHCGTFIDTDDYEEFNGEILCSDCIDNFTSVCDCCGERIWSEDTYGDEYTTLCYHCYNNHYTRCEECDSIIHNDDAYEYDSAVSAIRTSAGMPQSTNTATSLRLSFTAIQIAISV